VTDPMPSPKNFSLVDLIERHELRLMVEACHKACGVAVSIKDVDDDQVLVGAGWQVICAGYHRVHPVSRERCIQSQNRPFTPGAGMEVQDMLCHNGLRHLSFPMLVDGRHIATYYLTQFFYDTDVRDTDAFEAQARELGFDEEEYLAALAEVPVLSRERAQEIISYMGTFSRLITDLATRNLRLKLALQENERIQTRLRETTALTESILNVIASPLFLKDRSGVYTGCNDAFSTFLERPREEFIGKGVFDLYPEVEARKYFEMDEALMAADVVQMYDFRMSRKDGAVREVMFSKAATHDAHGKVSGIVGVITDITERNQVARALRESQQTSPENNVVLVLAKSGDGAPKLKGAVSVWKVLEAMDECVLRDPELRVVEDSDFDQTFARACAVCTHTSLARHLESDVPMLKPGDPLPVVLELFLRKKRGWAVVEENGKVLGVVLVADVYREISRDMTRAF